jgi:ABC-type thiamin/hydroxymethylpyrimidine transport system permease subunit
MFCVVNYLNAYLSLAPSKFKHNIVISLPILLINNTCIFIFSFVYELISRGSLSNSCPEPDCAMTRV